jgi:two-component sensor histidine kinase
MTRNQGDITLDRETVHTLKNQLAIITSYADLLTTQTSDDPRRLEDLTEIKLAAATALALLSGASSG